MWKTFIRTVYPRTVGFKLIFIIILITIFFTGCQNKTTPSFEGFELTKNFMESDNSQSLTYSNDKNIIRLKVISNLDEISAEKIIDSSVLTMQSLYDNTFTSYPGRISMEIVCDSRFVPEQMSVHHNGKTITYLIAYLSERLIYGACTDDLTSYKGVIAWSYCEDKNELRQFEFISRKDSFSESSIDFVKENICK